MYGKGSKSKGVLAGGVCALALTIGWSAHAEGRNQLHVPREALAQSLRDVARQTRSNILFAPEAVSGLKGRALNGAMTAQEAVSVLITGLPLEVVNDDAGGLIVRRRPIADGSAVAAGGGRTAATTAVDEVIVTATKRPEAARKISGSVSALGGTQLEALGANSFSDYITMVPGVVLNAAGPGLSPVTIRGISTTDNIAQGQGATGYFINDVPLTEPFFSVGIPDIDTFDVDNVAVLRGPQGTLFGSASLGGSINYQAAKPNLEDYQVHAQGTFEGVDGGGSGGSGKLMVNLPLAADKFAIRGVYVYRDDPGYIHNIGTGMQDSNEVLVRGGRVEATWKPGGNTTVNYLFLDQVESNKDLGYVEPALGPLTKQTLFREPYDFHVLIHNLRVDHDLGFATLTATATHHEKTEHFDEDGTALFGALLPGAAPVHLTQDAYSRGSTFEVRLASTQPQRLDYIVGAYYDNTHEDFVNKYYAPGAAGVIQNLYGPFFGPNVGVEAAPGDVFGVDTLPFHGKEGAIFGEATYHISDQWKITLGGREFETRSENISTSSGLLQLFQTGTLTSVETGSQKETGFTPKGSVTWTPDQDVMVYGLVSKGFRFGGPNIIASTSAVPVPATFGSDSLINYEIGTRTNWLDGRLLLDASVFYIDWTDIQLELTTPAGYGYTVNAGKATSYGFEGTATWRIAPSLTFQNNLTYLDAKLAQDFGSGFAAVPKGTTLPGASKWQVSSTLSYTWADGPCRPTFLATNRYISRAPGDFQNGVPQGGYDLINGRITGHFKAFDVSLFVNNITNARGVTSGNDFSAFGKPLQEYLVQPRIFGVTLDYKM